MENKKLSERETSFCRFFAAGLPGNKAAELAGYSRRTAGATAGRILKKESAKKRIEMLKGGEAGTLEDEITDFLLSIMRGDEYDEKKDSVIKERLRAAELLGKRRSFEGGDEEKTKIIIVDDIPGKGKK